MFATTKSGKKIQLLTDEEDERITAAAMSDPDAIPYTDAEFEEALPRMQRHGKLVVSAVKEEVTIALTPAVVDVFRETGEGWQARMDAALQDWLKDHTPA